MDFLPLTLRARSNAPMTFDVRLTWSSPRLLEGRLQLHLISGPATMLRYRTQELTLTNGPQTFRVMTPPAQSLDFNSQMTVRAEFVAKDRTFDLGEFPLFTPSKSERSLVICAATSLGRLNPAEAKLVQSLRFERFNPDALDPQRRVLQTSIADVRADDLPIHPLGYCSYDAVVLTQSGFSAAKERGLKALLQWTRAGGSVCIFLGAELKEHHIEFLNELAGADKLAPKFVLDGTRLGFGDGVEASGLMQFRSELGRAVVVKRTLDLEHGLDAPPWRQATAFLWKMRNSHLNDIRQKGKWGELPADLGAGGGFDQWGRPIGAGGERLGDFGVVTFPFSQQISEALMPKSVRLVPFGVIIAVLSVFLFAIGPMDYFGLGILRRRKYTWVLFPCVAIAFTVFTVYLSDYYMGRKDYRHSVTIVDIGKSGAVLRESRVDLIFAARERESVTEVKGGIFIPLEAQPWNSDIYSGERASNGSQPSYEGNLPMLLRATQSIKQWTPQLNRIFTMDAAAAKNDVVNWDAFGDWFEAEGQNRNWDWSHREPVQQMLFKASKPEGEVFLFREGQKITVFQESESSSVHWLTKADEPMRLRHRQFYGQGDVRTRILDWLCSGHGRGLNAVTSRLSPTGDGNLEDLTAHDPTDADECLLVVVVKRGEDYFIYRRLYHAK